MKNFQSYANYLFNFIHIPLFLYDKQQNYIDCYPEIFNCYQPVMDTLQKLFQYKDTVSYVCIHDEVYWGLLRFDDDNHCLVVGPIAQISLSTRAIESLAKDYVITPENRKDFFEFYSGIPCLLLPSFLNLMLFLDCSLNKKPSAAGEKLLTPWDMETLPIHISSEHQEAFYHHSENEMLYNNNHIENEFCSIIEAGNLKKLKEFARSSHQTARYGSIARDHIRQLKNTFIILSTLASRAAIRGGLSPVFAYQVADSYIEQVEDLWDETSIYGLMQTLQIDFCKRVAATKKIRITDNAIQNAIDYVHANMNKNINVDVIAHAVGLSRSHLSRRFKQELGFSLSDFIRRCKLEEAKSLLLYTDKSLSHISEYLCFSSQSHFQTIFKKQFGITPSECRKQRALPAKSLL